MTGVSETTLFTSLLREQIGTRLRETHARIPHSCGGRILVAEIDWTAFAGSNPRGVEVTRGGVGDDLFLHDPDTATDSLFGDAGDDTLAGDAEEGDALEL